MQIKNNLHFVFKKSLFQAILKILGLKYWNPIYMLMSDFSTCFCLYWGYDQKNPNPLVSWIPFPDKNSGHPKLKEKMIE